MCGFAGYYNLSKANFIGQRSWLDAMQFEIAHRGPDDYGTWLSQDNQLGLANRRLAILDLSQNGHQPMTDASGSIVISFNGEIYNFQELKNILIRSGYQFKSDVDTEVLIYAYKHWGISFLDKLEGMFAFALYDQLKNELYLVRDRIGVKPHYFSLQQGIISFASEIKALWKLPWNNKNVSMQGLYHYLTFMVTPAPYTLYEKVYKLPAGFYAKVSPNKAITFHEWYNPLNVVSASEQHLYKQEAFCVDKIDFLLQESTKKRMLADVPVGAFLSGGIDSSLNVALMAKFTSKINTFTVSFNDMPTDDKDGAALVAQKFGANHHHLEIGEQDAYAFYQDMVHFLDEPLADCVCIPFYFVSKLARDNGVKVVQVGEGADELFYGYPLYARYKKFHDKIFKPLQKIIPYKGRKGISKAVSWFYSRRPDYTDLAYNWAEKRDLLWGGATAFGEAQKRLLLNESFGGAGVDYYDTIVSQIYSSFRQGFDSFAVIDYHKKRVQKVFPEENFFQSLLYLELKQRLPELLLMRADKMSMATSVEARVPFLDYKLVEFMLQVSPELNCLGNENKYLLKKVALRYLPKEIVYRKKVGFAAPTQRWYENGSQFSKLFNSYSDDLKNKKIFKASAGDLSAFFDLHPSLLAVQKWTFQNFWAIK